MVRESSDGCGTAPDVVRGVPNRTPWIAIESMTAFLRKSPRRLIAPAIDEISTMFFIGALGSVTCSPVSERSPWLRRSRVPASWTFAPTRSVPPISMPRRISRSMNNIHKATMIAVMSSAGTTAFQRNHFLMAGTSDTRWPAAMPGAPGRTASS